MNIGIIGLGDMGKMYAKIWATNPKHNVYGCDLPQRFDELTNELSQYNIKIVHEGIAISRLCDLIIYAVEAENINEVVAKFGPSTKIGAIVAGQTSVKTPEIEAFEQYLPLDTHIVTCHSLHGPAIHPIGQTMMLIRHRADETAYLKAKNVFGQIGSTIFEVASCDEHDKMMADIQAITHVGFESIGTTWMRQGVFPWANDGCKSGLDHVKILMTLRIYSYKFHVYSGLALMNPHARNDVKIYAKAVSDLFSLMIEENETDFRTAIYAARDFVFANHPAKLMLDDAILSEFALNQDTGHKPNSHLSLLAMVVTWHRLGVNPYQNHLVQTPPFKLRVGMAEYLFLNEERLEESIKTALFEKTARGEDLAFHTSVHEWANIVANGDKAGYKNHFETTKAFLADRLEEGRMLSTKLIEKLNERG
jgi:prephenate dehydrogenase (NADP+)